MPQTTGLNNLLLLDNRPRGLGTAIRTQLSVSRNWWRRSIGLRVARRLLGAVGLSLAALFLVAAMFATVGREALLLLSFAYPGRQFQQPSLAALRLDVGQRNFRAVFGFMNMAGYAASALSSVVYGYLVTCSGNYHTPFVPMVAPLALGALLWSQVDALRPLFPRELVMFPPCYAFVASCT